MGGAAAFTDGPDDEALAAAHVAGAEDAVEVCHVVFIDGDIAAGVFLEVELLDRAGMLGMDKAHRQKTKIAVEIEFAAGDFLHLITPIRVSREVELEVLVKVAVFSPLHEKSVVEALAFEVQARLGDQSEQKREEGEWSVQE